VTSALGGAKPKHLLIAPVSRHGAVNAVVELGFFHEGHPSDLQLLERCAELIAVGVHSANDRARLEELLEETQRQAEELQTQQEELRVSNEELEQQSTQLKESQALLENQHAELEQTNVQLEEQTSLLENQKDVLLQAQSSLASQAEELARSNHYKSEFLANMSHELRTPLNSSLILAKLLADNKPGNLNDEQVSFARTIFSAGNDLLALINDILDLSKIEAGKVDVHPEPVAIARIVDEMHATFDPVARDKGLAFTCNVESGVPDRMQTDPQRLAQILRNLLSNAMKFTESGEVAMRVHAPSRESIAFDVRDTGIGIPAHQQDVIFEAFRQADGSTHRKYGGTGLGLSIARDLARLLGGDVRVRSESGTGSTFTLELPLRLTVAPVATRTEPPPAPVPRTAPAKSPPTSAIASLSAPMIEDDRQNLPTDARTLLIVEDDVAFAGVLRDLAREQGFLTVVVHTGADAVSAAQQYHVHAIVLDMHLPDRSGLVVLDEL
jgi:signal transduction histidine kinase